MKIIFNNEDVSAVKINSFSRNLHIENEQIEVSIQTICDYTQVAAQYLTNLFFNNTEITSIKILNDLKQIVYSLDSLHYHIDSVNESIWETGSNISINIK